MTLDLFTPLVPAAEFHPAFQQILLHSTSFERDVLNQWAEGFADRDGKFVKEFQTTFDSSFWELYLFAAFKELGMQCDLTKCRPDFCVVSPETFSVEAVVSLNAEGAPRVFDAGPPASPPDLTELNRQGMIRLLNSLDSKHRKFSNSYRNLEYVKGRPFVVAVAPFDQPQFQLQAQRVIEAVLYRYYVDEDAFLQSEGGEKHPEPRDMEFVTKDSGVKLPLGVFCDRRMAGISAVIQSTSGTWTKVTTMSNQPDAIINAVYEDRRDGGLLFYRGPNALYNERLLDGLRVYHNPFADHPLDPDLFQRDEIFQATSDGVASLILQCPARRILACHQSLRIQAGMMERTLAEMSTQRSFWYTTTSERYRDARRTKSKEP